MYLFISNKKIMLIALLIFTACELTTQSSQDVDEKLSIRLEPPVARIGEPVDLVIKNNTSETYRYHRGHRVEKREKGRWVPHQSVGTFMGPVDIKPGEQFIQENILLDATEPGVYRVILIIRTEEEPFPDTRRPSEPVRFIASTGT